MPQCGWKDGIEEVPVWALGLAIGYAGVLFLAALWAIVERTRWAMLKRRRRLDDATALRVPERRASEENAPTSALRA
jgi:hypothetical protein